MKSVVCAAAVAAVALSLAGCATVTRGTTTTFKVTSDPTGADVKTSTGFSCSPTPCSMKLQRKDPFDVTISLAGYQSQTVHVDSRVSGNGTAGLVGNVVAGGVIGMVVDGTDGAMNDLVPNPLAVNLVKSGSADAAAPAPTGTK